MKPSTLADAYAKQQFGMDPQEAGQKQICVICKAEVGEFRDDKSKREYDISRMCQKCQDETFGRDSDEDYSDDESDEDSSDSGKDVDDNDNHDDESDEDSSDSAEWVAGSRDESPVRADKKIKETTAVLKPTK